MQLLLVMPDFADPSVWMSLLTLTFLEIVLGIDNIIFISIAASRLPEKLQKKASNIGLALAMILRVALLFGINILIQMNQPISWLTRHSENIHFGFTGQSLIMIAGGIFLLYKATSEIHHKLEGSQEDQVVNKKVATLGAVILEITIINIVFSFDSILTAVGMTNGVEGALLIMIVAVVLSVIIMMLFAVPVGRFINKHPTLQMLGLAFLILIGVMLLAEGAHMAHLSVFGSETGAIPKGYLYFAIAFSLGVEMLNMQLRKKGKTVKVNDAFEQAGKEGVIEENV